MRSVLEVCVDSTASALAAKRGGASRLELCADLIVGGTTPSLALVRQVKAETGLLTPEGQLNADAMRPIYAAARRAAEKAGRPVACTLHRAFDVSADPFAALETVRSMGLCTILTSGQAASAPEGAELLGRLVERAGDSVEILVGAGVTAQNIPALAAQTGAHAFHLSGKQVLQSRMTFRREGVPMGLPGFSEFEVWQTGEENIRAARQALDAIKNN